MAKKCPRCGSKNTECINRGKQVGGFILKIGAAAACNIIGAMVGHSNAGKNIGGLFLVHQKTLYTNAIVVASFL